VARKTAASLRGQRRTVQSFCHSPIVSATLTSTALRVGKDERAHGAPRE
jgi:hypothetical protein